MRLVQCILAWLRMRLADLHVRTLVNAHSHSQGAAKKDTCDVQHAMVRTISIKPVLLLRNNASLHTSSVHQERAKGQLLKAAQACRVQHALTKCFKTNLPTVRCSSVYRPSRWVCSIRAGTGGSSTSRKQRFVYFPQHASTHRLPAWQGVAGVKGLGQCPRDVPAWSTHTAQSAVASPPAWSVTVTVQATRASCLAPTATPLDVIRLSQRPLLVSSDAPSRQSRQARLSVNSATRQPLALAYDGANTASGSGLGRLSAEACRTPLPGSAPQLTLDACAAQRCPLSPNRGHDPELHVRTRVTGTGCAHMRARRPPAGMCTG